MLSKLKKFSLTFSPKALLFGRPDRSLNFIQILEFNFFSPFFSKTDCYCLPVILSKKEKEYINFRVLHTKVKLFNSFTCKTTYSLLVKELNNSIFNIFSLLKKNLLII